MKTNKITLGTIYRLTILIVSTIISIYMIYNNNNYAYRYYFVVPILFGILICLVKPIANNIDRMGMLVLNGVLIIKYMIMPFINCMSNYSSWRGFVPNTDSIEIGVILTIYEMLVIILTIAIFGNKFYKQSDNNLNLRYNEKNFIYLVFIAIGIIILCAFPSLIHNYRFVLKPEEIVYSEINMPSIGLLGLLVDFSKVCASILIISWCKKKYEINNKLKYILLAGVIVIINLLFSSGMSRWTLAVPGVIFTFILIELFPKYKKSICILLLAVVILTVFILSIEKSFGESYSSESMNVYWLSDTLQMYFSGPKNIGIAIEAKAFLNNNTTNIGTMINDLFSSAAGLSSITDFNNTSIAAFNYRYYYSNISTDQIIPMVGQGYLYFGYILAPIFSCICIYFLMFIDYKLYKTQEIILYYLYGYIAIWLARAITLNTTIVFSHIFNTSIVFLTIYLLNKHILLKKSY